MATGGGQISLPLAVGVDHGHPQAAGGGLGPPPVDGYISFFFFLFFWWFVEETKMAIGGWPNLSPLVVGVDSGHSQWPDFFLGSPKKSPEMEVGGGVCSPKVGGGWRWWRLGTGCFDSILNLYIFFKSLRCQLMSGEQKTPPLCHDRMATALFIILSLQSVVLNMFF